MTRAELAVAIEQAASSANAAASRARQYRAPDHQAFAALAIAYELRALRLTLEAALLDPEPVKKR